jgi:hypothetical protein
MFPDNAPKTNDAKLRIFLADDHAVVRQGLRALVTPSPTWR